MRLKIITIALLAAAPAIAAGGGGSAGGSGAQNSINSGRSIADGQPGPPGAVNHPRASLSQARPQTSNAPPAPDRR